MEKTIEVIKLIADKYRDKVNAIMSEDALIIEYLYEINGEKDVFKTIQIKEANGIMYASIYPDNNELLITINDLERIFQKIEDEIISKKKLQQKDRYKDYLEMFDKLFETDAKEYIDFQKMKLLKSFHNYFAEELYEPSKEYNRIRKEFLEYADNLREQLTKDQKEVFDKAIDLCTEMTEERQRVMVRALRPIDSAVAPVAMFLQQQIKLTCHITILFFYIERCEIFIFIPFILAIKTWFRCPVLGQPVPYDTFFVRTVRPEDPHVELLQPGKFLRCPVHFLQCQGSRILCSSIRRDVKIRHLHPGQFLR